MADTLRWDLSSLVSIKITDWEVQFFSSFLMERVAFILARGR